MDRRVEEADDAAMARTTITHLTDDDDGSKDAEEVSFSFMGTDADNGYEIPLGAGFEGCRRGRQRRPGMRLPS